MAHYSEVKVLAAEVGITVGGFYLKDAVAELQNRDVERTAAQVIDRDLFVLFLVQTVGQRSCRRLWSLGAASR